MQTIIHDPIRKIKFWKNIPAELKPIPRFLNWRWEINQQGKPTKPPYIPGTQERADFTDPAHLRSYKVAIRSYRDSDGFHDGIGFSLTESLGIVGGDIDHCIDPVTGEIAEWALKIIARF